MLEMSRGFSKDEAILASFLATGSDSPVKLLSSTDTY